MGSFTNEQLRQRAFERVAWVLHHFWEEQKDLEPRAARVHSRIFEFLIPVEYVIVMGRSVNGDGYVEHVVPCAVIRDLAFKLFWDNKTVRDVAQMIGRLLRVAHITKEEARRLDYVHHLKDRMPDGWDHETGSVTARLEIAGIELMVMDHNGVPA